METGTGVTAGPGAGLGAQVGARVGAGVGAVGKAGSEAVTGASATWLEEATCWLT